jgi:hypothetical protein
MLGGRAKLMRNWIMLALSALPLAAQTSPWAKGAVVENEHGSILWLATGNFSNPAPSAKNFTMEFVFFERAGSGFKQVERLEIPYVAVIRLPRPERLAQCAG